MTQLKRYLFEYKLSDGSESEFSLAANSEEEARIAIKERIADIEFVDEKDVIVGDLIKTLDVKDNYFECEGCT